MTYTQIIIARLNIHLLCIIMIKNATTDKIGGTGRWCHNRSKVCRRGE